MLRLHCAHRWKTGTPRRSRILLGTRWNVIDRMDVIHSGYARWFSDSVVADAPAKIDFRLLLLATGSVRATLGIRAPIPYELRPGGRPGLNVARDGTPRLDQVNVRAVENKAVVEHRDSDRGTAA